ncbi:nucleotidyltransferase domain-containing protein [Candidatus Woesearchaeota archaeon]|nr:nucleotidyltransferase domain-containing protein [Candidatus Woesearchaeota archaeon]
MKRYKAIAYVQQALSFLFINEKNAEKIRAIYLYGSAARDELTQESDIDIFIDCEEKDEKKMETEGKSAISRFYESKEYEKWKILRFTHPISINTGNVRVWELNTSISSEGILLYSRQTDIIKGKKETLFIIELPSKKEQYLKFTRKFFGRKEKYYRGEGILHNLKGKKISSNVFIIPKEYQQETMTVLGKLGVNYSMKEYYILE